MQEQVDQQRSDRSGRLSVGIVGGGLGGLTAALALSRYGFEVDVFEQAPQLTEVGGGLLVGPNAVRILERLGLGPRLARDGVLTDKTMQRRWEDGRILNRSSLNPGLKDMYGSPQYTVHRADLQEMLASSLPSERIHLGSRFVQLDDTGDGVEAEFSTGERFRFDVLVGADGIRSGVRTALFGETEPDFSGLVAYRGLISIDRIPDPEMATTSQGWLGPGGHFLHYPVSGGRLLNFVGWTEHDSWNREDWTDRATISRALAAFADWHPQVHQIISMADTCFIWALFDRQPLPLWSVGRATLLGDACHPMYPFMGQGAGQAIEDGAVLAECLLAAGGDEASGALRRYESLRRPRVTLLQEMSRANKAILHAPDGPMQTARDARWAAAGEVPSDAMKWLYGFDAQNLEDMDFEAVHNLLPGPR